jgi:hypothetical protein
MKVMTVARNKKSTLFIDKNNLSGNQNDLGSVALPFSEEDAEGQPSGTTVLLSDLDRRLNFPTPERLREVLIYEYGREDSFRVFVNDVALSVEDIPGKTTQLSDSLPTLGAVSLRFTIADGKRPPRMPGIILKVNGKAVGRPMLFGLDEDDDIPHKLARCVYGEIELNGAEDFVTADWGAILENSKGFQEAQSFIRAKVKAQLSETHARDLALQKARLQKEIHRRLQNMPEFRRRYAEEALNKILSRFYGESADRISVIAEVALDAMEYDTYWILLDKINALSQGDVGNFAEALEEFGLLELTTIGVQASRRRQILDYFDKLVQNPDTLEKDTHKALETNLWMLGRQYSTMSSNSTLKKIVENLSQKSLNRDRAKKRPDLLLSQDHKETYLLIEFKRPSHPISRDDIAQAEKYRDDLLPNLPSTTSVDIMMIGKGRVVGLDLKNLPTNISIHSYASLISAARTEVEWLITSLSKGG